MTGQEWFSQRMLLRASPDRERVHVYTKEMGWRLRTKSGDPQKGNFRATFTVQPGVYFHYVEDFVSRQRYFYVSSVHEDAVDIVVRLTVNDLEPCPVSELLAACDQAEGLERGRAIMRLGVAAPYEFDAAVFDRVRTGLRDSDARVRRLSAWATSYSPWQEYVPLLRSIALDDDDAALRERVAGILEVFASHGLS